MIPNNTPENSLTGTHIAVPSIDSPTNPPVVQHPTLYHYLVLIPAIITAVTPLILGLRGKTSSNPSKEES
ncbi:MAG: hypothetical protein ICV78_00665 [Tolypothrix sp. Co-bin9]|nr:hypothetical protein [Tolypothrix sp. Co-bin9]